MSTARARDSARGFPPRAPPDVGAQAPPHPPKGFLENTDKQQVGLIWVVGWVDQNALGRILKVMVVAFSDRLVLPFETTKLVLVAPAKGLSHKRLLSPNKLNRRATHIDFLFFWPLTKRRSSCLEPKPEK